MVRAGVGRLVVVELGDAKRVTGILTRGDLLGAHGKRLDETHEAGRNIRIRQAVKQQLGRK